MRSNRRSHLPAFVAITIAMTYGVATAGSAPRLGILRNANKSATSVGVFKSFKAMTDCAQMVDTDVSMEAFNAVCNQGLVATASNGTHVEVLETLSSAASKVKIVDGRYAGAVGYVPSVTVELSEPKSAGTVKSIRFVHRSDDPNEEIAMFGSEASMLPCLAAEQHLERHPSEEPNVGDLANALDCASKVEATLAPGTRVELLATLPATPRHRIARIRVLEGAYKGKVGVVRAEWLRAEAAE